MQQTDWRDEPITIEQNRAIYYIGGGALLVILGIIIGAVLFAGENPTVDEPSGYYTNLFTEMMGIAVTVFVLNALARRREDARLKEQLVSQAKSRSNAVAIEAIDILRHKGWLTGENGALQNADLAEADLENADLRGVRMRGADLSFANLNRADLVGSDLQSVSSIAATLREARLRSSNLREIELNASDMQKADLVESTLQEANLAAVDLRIANLGGADLRRAKLSYANMQGADLTVADLSGADLREAKLQNAYINISDEVTSYGPLKTQFDETTILPDGTHWTPDTDWTQFGAFTDWDAYKAWLRSQGQDE